MTWPVVALGDICELKYGKSLAASLREDGPFPVMGSNGIVGSHVSAITSGPTVVIGRKGSIGAVAYTSTPSWPIDTTYFIDGTTTGQHLRWLFWRLRGLGLDKMNKSAAVPGLNRDDAYRVTFPLPPLPEQRRIAAILDDVDDFLANGHRSTKLLDEVQRRLYLTVFGDPIENPRQWDRKPVGSLALKYSDGPFGSDLKSDHYTSNGMRVVRLQNIGDGEFVDSDRAFVSEAHAARLQKHICLPGDVLIGTLGDPNLRACLLPESVGRAINKADVVQLRADPSQVDPQYLVATLNNESVVRAASRLVLGQTRGRISMGRLRGFEINVPPLSVQHAFAAQIHQIGESRALATAHSAKLDELFASLQYRAFRGEL